MRWDAVVVRVYRSRLEIHSEVSLLLSEDRVQEVRLLRDVRPLLANTGDKDRDGPLYTSHQTPLSWQLYPDKARKATAEDRLKVEDHTFHLTCRLGVIRDNPKRMLRDLFAPFHRVESRHKVR